MARYSPEHKQETHQKIVSVAGRLFRGKGYSATGIDEVMNTAGLTQGGFYRHFPSKEGLLKETIVHAFNQTRALFLAGLDKRKPEERMSVLAKRLISKGHSDCVEESCPTTSLVNEVAHSSQEVQAAFEAEIEKSLKQIEQLLPNDSDLSTRERSLALTALGIGAVSLSRAVASEQFSEEILRVARKAALQIGR